jgi:hypothetical protein
LQNDIGSYTVRLIIFPELFHFMKLLTHLAEYPREYQSACERLRTTGRSYSTAAGAMEAVVTGEGNAILISHGSGGGFDMGLWLANLIGGPYRFLAPSRFGYL